MKRRERQDSHPARSQEDIMTIVRWDPFRDFGFTSPSTWMPPVDIFQTGEHELVLKTELPDMSRDDITINIENFVLTIAGEKKAPAEVKDEQYHHVERRYGSFSRSFSLPQTVDPNRVSAEYKHGVLTVKLPLREEAKPRSIKVDVAA
jgi:HSP20 family protein